MAPIPEDTVDNILKTIIQTLYELQSTTHGYQGPATQAVLISQIHSLAASLATLSHSAANSTLTTLVPPEIIAYIDEGRNPDIYTREFVELVQRGNVFLKGKSEAFGGFADVLGEEMEAAGVGMGMEDGGVVVKKEEGGEEEEEEGVEEEKGGGAGMGGVVKEEAKMDG